MEGFEKRVQEVMEEINKDAVALRHLREEAIKSVRIAWRKDALCKSG